MAAGGRKKTKGAVGARTPEVAASQVNAICCIDFVSNSLSNARLPKCLTVDDDFSQEGVDFGIGGE